MYFYVIYRKVSTEKLLVAGSGKSAPASPFEQRIAQQGRRPRRRTKEVTKQKTRYTIELPAEVVAVLEWHVATQLATPEQQRSDSLFPSVTGRFRPPSNQRGRRARGHRQGSRPVRPKGGLNVRPNRGAQAAARPSPDS